MSDANYILLPGRGVRTQLFGFTAGRCRVAQAPDHLLAIETVGYTENYKRYFFRDIQALTVQHTQGWWWITLALGVPALLVTSGLIALLTSNSDEGTRIGGGIALGILWLLFSLPLLVNLFRGPTCITRIHTAVQTEELPSLKRRRVAGRVLALLQPLIVSAQGSFAPGELAGRLAARSAAAIATPPARAPVTAPTSVPLVPYQSRAHVVMSWIAASDLAGTPLSLAFNETWTTFYSAIHILALLIAAIVALVKQSNTNLPVWLRRLPVILIVGVLVLFVLSIIVGIAYAVANPQAIQGGQLAMLDDPMILTMTIVSTLTNGGLGIWGLLLWRQFKKAAASGEST